MSALEKYIELSPFENNSQMTLHEQLELRNAARDELAQLRMSHNNAWIFLEGGYFIAKAFLQIKANSPERDESVPNTIQWLEDVGAWLKENPK